MVDPVTGWFEIMQYYRKGAKTIEILLETVRLTRYPYPTEITYDQGSEFIGHKFKNYLIQK